MKICLLSILLVEVLLVFVGWFLISLSLIFRNKTTRNEAQFLRIFMMETHTSLIFKHQLLASFLRTHSIFQASPKSKQKFLIKFLHNLASRML